MTPLQAKQINAYMMLNSAFWHIYLHDHLAAILILDARGALALEMDSHSLLTAIALSEQLEDTWRAA